MERDYWFKVVGFFTIIGALAALLVVPEVRKGIGLDVPDSLRPNKLVEVKQALPAQSSDDTTNVQAEKREWTVVVPGNVKWLNTGIKAQKGVRLNIHAVGTVTWGPPGLADGSNVVDPNGTRPPYRQDSTLFPIPEAGIGSLIMRIGHVKYAVGASDLVEVKESGTVEFMVNDDVVGDNSGRFTVTIQF